MRIKLETAHHYCSIGTFVLTAVIVALMVIPMLRPPDASPQPNPAVAVQGRHQMIGWVMPSILAFCLLLASVLNILAARMRREPSLDRTHTDVTEKRTTVEPPAHTTAAQDSGQRIFVGPDITPQFLFGLLSGHTEVQAGKLLDIYVGKWMRLSGAVDHVGKFEYGSSTVSFSSQSFNGVLVYMEFGAAWTERLSVLRLGNNINIIGRITSVTALRVKLQDCELV